MDPSSYALRGSDGDFNRRGVSDYICEAAPQESRDLGPLSGMQHHIGQKAQSNKAKFGRLPAAWLVIHDSPANFPVHQQI